MIAMEVPVRGQDGPGPALRGYRAEPNVANDFNTETFVAMRLGIDNWRWAGVPVQTCNRRAARGHSYGAATAELAGAAHLSPTKEISLQFEVKRPGPVVDLAAVHMDFRYRDWFPARAERRLRDPDL